MSAQGPIIKNNASQGSMEGKAFKDLGNNDSCVNTDGP